METSQYSSQDVDHLGIVAGMCYRAVQYIAPATKTRPLSSMWSTRRAMPVLLAHETPEWSEAHPADSLFVS